jgi:hypothetical protein
MKKTLLVIGLIAVAAIGIFIWGKDGADDSRGTNRTASTDATKAASSADPAGIVHLRSMADALGCSSEAEFANDLDFIARGSAGSSTDLGDESPEAVRHRLLATTPGMFSPAFSVSLLKGGDLESCHKLLEKGVATPEDVIEARRLVRQLDELLGAKAQSFASQHFADVSVDASALKIQKFASSLKANLGAPDTAMTGSSRPTIPVFSAQEARQLKQLADFLHGHAAVRFAFPEHQFHSLYDELGRRTIPRISADTLEALLRAVNAERDEVVQFYEKTNKPKVAQAQQDYAHYADLLRILARQPTSEKYSAQDHSAPRGNVRPVELVGASRFAVR